MGGGGRGTWSHFGKEQATQGGGFVLMTKRGWDSKRKWKPRSLPCKGAREKGIIQGKPKGRGCSDLEKAGFHKLVPQVFFSCVPNQRGAERRVKGRAQNKCTWSFFRRGKNFGFGKTERKNGIRIEKNLGIKRKFPGRLVAA